MLPRQLCVPDLDPVIPIIICNNDNYYNIIIDRLVQCTLRLYLLKVNEDDPEGKFKSSVPIIPSGAQCIQSQTYPKIITSPRLSVTLPGKDRGGNKIRPE